MALSTATVTFDIADMLGNDFDPRRTKVWVTTNADTVIDTAGDKIRLGSGNATLNADGTGSIVVWVPGTGSNPASWQTTVHVDYPDRNAPSGRRTKNFGPFTITANANLADLVAEMPVQPEYASALADRIDGVEDHGNVSGSLELDSDTSTHWLDATGPLVLSFTDGPTGGTRYVSVLVVSGAADVTVADLEDVTLTDGAFATFAWVRGAWILAGAGGSTGGGAPSDATPPSAVTDLSATGGAGQVDLDWSAATDAESTVSYRYRVWLTSGGAAGTWTTTTATSATVTGLTAGAYTAEVYSYSAGGSTTPDTATATVTTPPPMPGDVIASDTFTATDGTLVTARPMDVGSFMWNSGSSSAPTFQGSTAPAIVSNKAHAAVNEARAMWCDPGTSNIEAVVTFTKGAPDCRARLSFGSNPSGSEGAWIYFSGTDVAFFVYGSEYGTRVTGAALTQTVSIKYDGTTLTVKAGATVIYSGARPASMSGTRIVLDLVGNDVQTCTADNFQLLAV